MSGQAMLCDARKRTPQVRVAAFSPHNLRRTFIGELIAGEWGVSPPSTRVAEGKEARAVATTARDERARLIVIATHGQGGPIRELPGGNAAAMVGLQCRCCSRTRLFPSAGCVAELLGGENGVSRWGRLPVRVVRGAVDTFMLASVVQGSNAWRRKENAAMSHSARARSNGRGRAFCGSCVWAVLRLDLRQSYLADTTQPELAQALVIGKRGAVADTDELEAFCRSRMGRDKVPHYVALPNEIPWTVTSKSS